MRKCAASLPASTARMNPPIWATWEHVDNPNRLTVPGLPDDFGLRAGAVSPDLLKLFADAGIGTEWQNYRLGGVQTDFVDSAGRPTLLANSVIERDTPQTSSFLTCHARAGIGPDRGRLDPFTSSGDSFNGAPDRSWFYGRGSTLKPAVGFRMVVARRATRAVTAEPLRRARVTAAFEHGLLRRSRAVAKTLG